MTYIRSFTLSEYRTLTVLEELHYRVDSADNLTSYDSVCVIPNRCSDSYYTQCGVRLTAVDGSEISRLLLFHGGGGIRDASVVVHNDSLHIACGVSICCVRLDTLELQWTAELLSGAGNGIYFPPTHDCILAVGDFDITSLGPDGRERWHTMLNSSLTPNIELNEHSITVYDDKSRAHALAIADGTILTG